MIKDQCLSITDLRTKTKQCLEEAEKNPKYVFVNNKPVAVIMNIDQYEMHFMSPDLVEMPEAEASALLKKEAQLARKIAKADLLNI